MNLLFYLWLERLCRALCLLNRIWIKHVWGLQIYCFIYSRRAYCVSIEKTFALKVKYIWPCVETLLLIIKISGVHLNFKTYIRVVHVSEFKYAMDSPEPTRNESGNNIIVTLILTIMDWEACVLIYNEINVDSSLDRKTKSICE